MSLDFCCDIQTVGSGFGGNNMKAWIYPAFASKLQAAGGVMDWCERDLLGKLWAP